MASRSFPSGMLESVLEEVIETGETCLLLLAIFESFNDDLWRRCREIASRLVSSLLEAAGVSASSLDISKDARLLGGGVCSKSPTSSETHTSNSPRGGRVRVWPMSAENISKSCVSIADPGSYSEG